MTNDKNKSNQIPVPMPTVNAANRSAAGAAGADPSSVRLPLSQSAASGGAGGNAKAAAAGMPGVRAKAAVATAVDGRPVPQQPEQKKHTKRTVLIVLLIVVVAIIVWLLVWLFACNGSSLFDPNARTGQAPYKTEEEIQAELDRVVEEGMFNIAIASVIEFEDGASEGTAYIENVPGNHYNTQVTIKQDETGDVLYESGVIAPNQYIENIALTKDLDPGTYECTATFHVLDTTTFDEVGQAEALVSVVVLN